MPKSPALEPLYDQDHIARMFNLHVHTIIRARRAGELRAYKIGRAVRLAESDVASWLEASRE